MSTHHRNQWEGSSRHLGASITPPSCPSSASRMDGATSMFVLTLLKMQTDADSMVGVSAWFEWACALVLGELGIFMIIQPL